MTLRGTLTTVLVALALYVFAMVAYVSVEVGRALRPIPGSEGVADLYDALNRRATELEDRVDQVEQILSRRVSDPAAVEAVRAELVRQAGRFVPQPFAQVPAPMRQALARTDVEVAALENLLLEVLALAELGRWSDAAERLDAGHVREHEIENLLRRAQVYGVAEFASRTRLLAEVTGRVRLAVTVWSAGWLIIALLVVAIAYRRIGRPLAALDRGLERIAEGDLAAHVDVHTTDEVGRLTAHFNEMTRVLRDRAEHQGRLAAAGELVAGVAHEVNNPLMAIALMAEARLEEGELPREVRAELQQIVRQGRRAGALVRGLLRVARPGERRVEPVDVNDVAAQAVDLVSYQFGVDEIQVERAFDPELPPARADTSRTEQVLVNLLSNAIQAVRGAPHPRRVRVTTFSADSSVSVAVEDNGPGVPEEIADRIFLPFFTTKGERGTGLGLYISKQVARDAGGDLVLDARRPGARFVLTLPAAAREAPRVGPASTDQSPPLPLSGLRVLLVDDESSVRRPLATFLRRRGAQVVEATDGLDALTKVERYPIDVVLLDLRMPRMDGIECYMAIKEMQPSLAARVIIVSGDLRQLEEAENVVVPRERLLAKPVDLVDLERRVRQVVTTTAPPPASSS